jgi:ribonuclease HII
MECAETITGFALTAGCDEAGRGCLAGPVFAAAVIFPPGFSHAEIRDSKKIRPGRRAFLAERIPDLALTYGIGLASEEEIDRLNILGATFLAMHRAIGMLDPSPEFLLIDGNRFRPYGDTPFECLVRGDDRVTAIAAASILAKHHRDVFMYKLHEEFPRDGWDLNKGYPTRTHIEAVRAYGRTPYHRKSFGIKGQLSLAFDVDC